MGRHRLGFLEDRLCCAIAAQVQIEGKDGILRDGDAILRVKLPFAISQDGSSLLEFDNVADQLQEVYRRFVADKKLLA